MRRTSPVIQRRSAHFLPFEWHRPKVDDIDRHQWIVPPGIGGLFPPESVDCSPRNRWTNCAGLRIQSL
jgi:hypothetical protein